MIVAYYQRCDSRSLSIISQDESEFKESRYIYIRYIVREIVPPASLLPTEGRREGEAIRTFVLTRNCNRSTTSMSNLTLFERYFSDPTLSRSTRFDILSLSLSFSFAHSSVERERERAASVKIEAWKITVTKRKRGSISRGRARIGEIRIGITGHRLRERTRKGAGNRGHRRLSTPRSRGDP